MPRTPNVVNYAVRLGNPAFLTNVGPPVTITTTVWYGVGYQPSSGPLEPYNFQPGDGRPRFLGPAQGLSVSYTYDPTTATYESVQTQLIALIAAQEGLTVGTDTINVS